MRRIVTLFGSLALCACGGSGGNDNTPQPPVNSTPTASDVAVITRPATPVTGTLSASDADGDALTFSQASAPANGTVTYSGTGDRDFEYTPNGGFAGVDTFTFSASDGSNTSNTATVSITVNTPPSVVGASFETSDIGTVSGTISASDAEADPVTFDVSSAPTKGIVTSLDPGTGEFQYAPTVGEDGLDSFSVTATDSAETSAPAVVNIEIFGWVGTQQFGSAAHDSLVTNGLVIKPDGSQVQAGVTTGQVASTPNAGAQDIFLRTTDRRGNQTSIGQFGTADDDVVRGLYLRPQGDGHYLIASGPGDNIYRYNNDGIEVFSVPLPVNGGVAVVVAAYWGAVDADGDLVVVSWINPGVPGALSGMVSKISGADGSLIWQRQLVTSLEDAVNFLISDTNRISPRGVGFDSSGNPVISGEYWDTGGARPCGICGFIAKFDADTGGDVWVREPDAFASCGVDGSGRLYRVAVAEDDTLYVTGIANFSQFPAADGFFARYNADATQELWNNCDNSGADTTFSFTNPLFTRDGGIVVYTAIGDANSPPDTNGGPSAADLFVTRFDTDGNITWSRRIQATRADGSAADLGAGSVAEDAQGILYITGFTDGELTSTANAGDEDAFVIRLAPDGTVQ